MAGLLALVGVATASALGVALAAPLVAGAGGLVWVGQRGRWGVAAVAAGVAAAWALVGVGFGAWGQEAGGWRMGVAAVVASVTAAVASVLGWMAVRARFARTSQPFSRQSSAWAFVRTQALLIAPLWATAVLLLWALLPAPTVGFWAEGSLGWGGVWFGAWAHAWAAALVLAPMAWELAGPSPAARVRAALQSLRADWPTTFLIVALGTAAAVVTPRWPAAGIALLLLLPLLLAVHAMRASPLAAHTQRLLAAAILLSVWARWPEPSALSSWPAVWAALAVASTSAVLQLLVATAQERRLALRRLDRQADIDPLTSLLSLSGLYRKLQELGERGEEAGDTRFGALLAPAGHEAPIVSADSGCLALLSVHLSNADTLEQILGAQHIDELQRAVGGALSQAAPHVRWARIAKAHFVGIHLPQPGDGDWSGLLTLLSVTAHEARALLEEQTTGRPLWTVAAIDVQADPIPPAEVLMACLRQAEQRARDSRHIQVLPVHRGAAQALKDEAAQAERIRQRIQAGALALYAQPIVANDPSQPLRHKYEILIRLRDDAGRVLPTDAWLPVAMRAGLMQQLDHAVIEQTFAWFAAHPKALAQLTHCAINLSGPTVAHPALAERIAQALAQHRLPAHKFTFEITESQAIANAEQAAKTLNAIRRCGCRVAIDDFGTGLATFDYLKRFEADYLKIDGAFIRELQTDPVDRAIVQSIVHVARVLGVRTVAEYVSTPELQQLVTALGVDESQGYVAGEPRPLGQWFEGG